MKEKCGHSKRRLPNKVTLVRELAHLLLVQREETSLQVRRDQALLPQLRLQPLQRPKLPQLSQLRRLLKRNKLNQRRRRRMLSMKRLRPLLRNLQHLPKLTFSQYLLHNQLQLPQLLQRKSILLKMAMQPMLRFQMLSITQLRKSKRNLRKKKSNSMNRKRKVKKILTAMEIKTKKKKKETLMIQMKKKKNNEYLRISEEREIN